MKIKEEGLGNPKQDLKSGVLGVCSLFDSDVVRNTCVAVFLQELLFLHLCFFGGDTSADIKNWRVGETEYCGRNCVNACTEALS